MKPANFAPWYAALYPQFAEITRQHGYALAVHGSMARDFDVVAIPWAAEVSTPREVIDHILREFAVKEIGEPTFKEHGRVAYTLSIGFGDCFADLSFMPIHRGAAA
ncbi:hypothetical protein [Sphingomonas ursincola]|uniref:hypothetical protein n=1 Tax=Sphingomonas ursincola TaxID=56361 RepID=UPI002356A8E6|nr:hypothetical protein [Sphingomonas ursincola]MBY0618443.1 hypothetical protein [Sphingomonas ursincola]